MGGRDIGVVSMVLTLGWGGVRGFVGLDKLTCSTMMRSQHHHAVYIYIQGVPGGMCQTSGGCSLW